MKPTTAGLARANKLCDAGIQLREHGRRREAEQSFRKALAVYPLPAARSNLALCRWQAGAYKEALAILQPLLLTTEPAPYAFALASLCLKALGRTDAARQYLDRAIRDMDSGLRDPSLRPAISDGVWQEYGVTVLQTAGSLGDHQLVLGLYKRWPVKHLVRGALAAGAAAFNLGQYDEATEIWGRVDDETWRLPIEACTSTARWIQARVAPPFLLPYTWDDGLPPEEAEFTEDQAKAMIENGLIRAFILQQCLDGNDLTMLQRASLATALVLHGGAWGLDLGRRLLETGAVPDALKVPAFDVLVQQGELPADRPVPIMLGGQRTLIHFRQLTGHADKDVLNGYDEAIRLRDAGQRQEAYRLLKDLDRARHLFPPVMVALANLMRERREWDQARNLLEMAEVLAPDDPASTANLVGLWLQRGNTQLANPYYQQLTQMDLSPELQRVADHLGQALEEASATVSATAGAPLVRLPSIEELGDAYRREIGDRTISPKITLRAALKGIPVAWLNAAAAALKIEPARLRKERAAQVAAALLTPEVLAGVVDSLQPAAQRALGVVLERGGSCKYQTVARFGREVGDGFWWNEAPPASPIGQLRARGLLYIGRARSGSRLYRTAVVPVELRPLLAHILGMEGR